MVSATMFKKTLVNYHNYEMCVCFSDHGSRGVGFIMALVFLEEPTEPF